LCEPDGSVLGMVGPAGLAPSWPDEAAVES